MNYKERLALAQLAGLKVEIERTSNQTILLLKDPEGNLIRMEDGLPADWNGEAWPRFIMDLPTFLHNADEIAYLVDGCVRLDPALFDTLLNEMCQTASHECSRLAFAGRVLWCANPRRVDDLVQRIINKFA